MCPPHGTYIPLSSDQLMCRLIKRKRSRGMKFRTTCVCDSRAAPEMPRLAVTSSVQCISRRRPPLLAESKELVSWNEKTATVCHDAVVVLLTIGKSEPLECTLEHVLLALVHEPAHRERNRAFVRRKRTSGISSPTCRSLPRLTNRPSSNWLNNAGSASSRFKGICVLRNRRVARHL